MCGIVGYWGEKSPKQVILAGLKRLEYRGYDSAGVAILNHGKFERVRAQGKLAELESKLSQKEFDGSIGIGHTRWATHGEPLEKNAHPHKVEGISLVHNGIIENYQELREKLVAQGVAIESDTDSELVAHVLRQEVVKTGDLLKAVEQTIPKLRGAYSIVAVWEKSPDQMVAFKDGPPLVVGIGQKEIVVASDVQAIIEHTKTVVYLGDKEVANINKDKVEYYTAQGEKIAKTPVEVNWSADQIEKLGYKHFMKKEIFEQPRAVAQAMAPHVDLQKRQVRLSKLGFGCKDLQELDGVDAAEDWKATQKVFSEIERVFIVACGTSFYAGMVGEYLIENFARLPVEVDIASEFRYRNPVFPKNTLLLTISQSGETADTLAVLRQAKEHGALTLSLCNVRHSSIDREAHGHIYMNAGAEIGVASTKAFTASITVLELLAVCLAQVRKQITMEQAQEITQELLAVPAHMEAVLNYDSFFEESSKILKTSKGFLYLGRGVSYPIAMEGALKLKELAYMHAEGYAAGEMKHGPLALIDNNMVVVTIAPKDQHYEKTVSNLEEAKARGGKIVAIGCGEDKELERNSVHYIGLPECPWYISPLLSVIPVQLLSYHVADSLGHDVDQPRNLAKSVTVE